MRIEKWLIVSAMSCPPLGAVRRRGRIQHLARRQQVAAHAIGDVDLVVLRRFGAVHRLPVDPAAQPM